MIKIGLEELLKARNSDSMTRRNVLALGGGLMASAATKAYAQAWPDRPIRIIVPYTTGGPGDTHARLVSDKLSELWKQPVVIDNRPGGGGSIGSGAVARSAPDGYTLLIQTLPHVTNAALSDLPFHPINDFTPIICYANLPVALTVVPSFPATSFAEFLDEARKAAGKMTLANSGIGSISHLIGLALEQREKIKFNHVPFPGSAQATTALMGGHVDAIFNSHVTAIPAVQGGKLKALCVTGEHRWHELPGLPTFAELGYLDCDCAAWWAFLGPAKMSTELTTRIYQDIRSVLKQPEVKQKFAAAGVEDILDEGPDDTKARLQSDLDKWTKIIRAAGIPRQ